MLEDNNQLTRFYTGVPTYGSFLVLVDYLESKVKAMKSWKGSNSNIKEKQHLLQCFNNLLFANQLFSIPSWLRLLITDVSRRFKIPEATYSHMFTMWICLLYEELHQAFQFSPSCEQVFQYILISRFKIYFPSARVIIDYEIECQWLPGLVNSSITYSHW